LFLILLEDKSLDHSLRCPVGQEQGRTSFGSHLVLSKTWRIFKLTMLKSIFIHTPYLGLLEHLQQCSLCVTLQANTWINHYDAPIRSTEQQRDYMYTALPLQAVPRLISRARLAYFHIFQCDGSQTEHRRRISPGILIQHILCCLLYCFSTCRCCYNFLTCIEILCSSQTKAKVVLMTSQEQVMMTKRSLTSSHYSSINLFS
jgi:hypothetical protein